MRNCEWRNYDVTSGNFEKKNEGNSKTIVYEDTDKILENVKEKQVLEKLGKIFNKLWIDLAKDFLNSPEILKTMRRSYGEFFKFSRTSTGEN